MIGFKTYLKENKMSISANRGDVAEVILGAAVTAKFAASPPNAITKKDIENVIAKVITSKAVKLTRPDMAKGGTNINDNINFTVGVPKAAWDFISKKQNWSSVDDLFKSSMTYVNSDRRLGLQCKALYRNLKTNTVKVDSDGTGDQKGTKADIKLIVDGKVTKNQISLKVKGGEQFAQVAGITFDKQVKIWGDLGVDVSSKKASFEKLLAKADLEARFKDRDTINQTDIAENVRNAAADVYKYAASELQKDFKNGTNLDKIASFIKSGATKNDENIEFVKLKSGGFQRARFGKKFIQNLKNLAPKLKIEYVKSGSDPYVTIYDPSVGNVSSNKARLIRIRAKYTAESSGKGDKKMYKAYMRNIVEGGELLFNLATDVV